MLLDILTVPLATERAGCSSVTCFVSCGATNITTCPSTSCVMNVVRNFDGQNGRQGVDYGYVSFRYNMTRRQSSRSRVGIGWKGIAKDSRNDRTCIYFELVSSVHTQGAFVDLDAERVVHGKRVLDMDRSSS